MPKLIIADVDTRFNGEYDVDISDLTNRELHFIYQQCQVTPVDIFRSLLTGHAGLVVALTAVMLERAGKQPDVAALWDAAAGLIRFDWSDEKAEVENELPPQTPPVGGAETSNDAETDDGKPTSGSRSRSTSADQAAAPKRSGGHG